MIFTLSTVIDADISRNGSANTILFGEKCMDPTLYYAKNTASMDPGDITAIFAGFAKDWERWGGNQVSPGTANSYPLNGTVSVVPTPPMRDRANVPNHETFFGSAHVDGLNLSACDGSGHWTSYNIDAQTFAMMCSRANASPIDASQTKW